MKRYHGKTPPLLDRHTCSICSKPFKDIKVHMLKIHGNGEGKRFLCRFCPKTFWEKSRLNEHETVHTKEKNFSCPKCQKKFRLAEALRRHMWIHTNKRIKCKFCESTFSSRNNYYVHIKVIHEKVRYQCPKGCGKEFVRKRQANDHAELCER